VAIEHYGSYQLIKRLATGGMAQIYLARQQGPDGFEKLLVVKRILPHLAENADFVRMFLDEARIAARLGHPNIVQIFNLGALDDSYFIAMEFIHGEDVRRVWKRAEQLSKTIPVELVCRVVMDACAGLDYAHKKTDSQSGRPLGIVHRDISPQNILVTFQGGVKVVDFGIAKAADQATVTRSGVLKGKYSYMSPEQASGKRVDCRSDIFALGVVLYELLTGARLFKRPNDILTLHAVTECDVSPPSHLNPDLPRDLDAIVMKALAKDPADRYQEAIHLQMALEDWLITHKLPSSSAHLAAFMEELYSDRLAEERRQGQVLVGEDLDSNGNLLNPPAPAAPPAPPPHQSQSHPSFSGPRMRSSSVDGRLPSPVERLTDRVMPLLETDEREATTAERGPRRNVPPSQDGVFRDLIKSAQQHSGQTPPPAPSGENPADTLIGNITAPDQLDELDDDLDDGLDESDPDDSQTLENPLTEPLPPIRPRGATGARAASDSKRGEATVAIRGTSANAKAQPDPEMSRTLSSQTSPSPLRRAMRMPPAALALLASSLVAGAVAGYILLGQPKPPQPPVTAPEPAYAVVHLESEPSGATVVFDGRPADPTPTTLPRVQPGTHQLVVGKPGFKDYVAEITVPGPGELQLPPIQLEPEAKAAPVEEKPAPVAAREVLLTVDADPAATVFVNNQARGKTPLVLRGAPRTEVDVRLERPGYRTSNRHFTFGEQDSSETVTLVPVGRPPPTRAKTAKVRFAVSPWADQVSCGGRNLGNTPFPDVEMPVGTHSCRIYNKTYGTRNVQIEVKPNILNKVPVKF